MTPVRVIDLEERDDIIKRLVEQKLIPTEAMGRATLIELGWIPKGRLSAAAKRTGETE